jgi:major membrane immunogen (membrane-anchored lipoprotein)
MNKTSLMGALVLLILLTSCSAQDRYKRLVKKHPEFVQIDTVTVTDTIIKDVKIRVPEYKDSFIFKHDTAYETKEVIIDKKGDRVWLTVKPKEIIVRDTVPFEVKVPGKVVTVEKTNYNYIWITLIVGLVVGFLLRRR